MGVLLAVATALANRTPVDYETNMKKIDQDELFQHLRGFLKSKGIALDSGTYAQRIHQGCNLLADAINATQTTVARAKAEVDKKLDQLRQSIHEATAPESSAASRGPSPSTSGKSAQAKGKTKRRHSARRNTKNSDASPNPEPTS